MGWKEGWCIWPGDDTVCGRHLHPDTRPDRLAASLADGPTAGLHLVYWGSQAEAKAILEGYPIFAESAAAVDAEVLYTEQDYLEHIRLWTLYSCELHAKASCRAGHILLGCCVLQRRLLLPIPGSPAALAPALVCSGPAAHH